MKITCFNPSILTSHSRELGDSIELRTPANDAVSRTEEMQSGAGI